MTSQAKRLKDTLREMRITDNHGKLSVRTQRNYVGTSEDGKQMYEYGRAVSHVRDLSDEEVTEIRNRLRHVNISNFPDLGYAIVKH